MSRSKDLKVKREHTEHTDDKHSQQHEVTNKLNQKMNKNSTKTNTTSRIRRTTKRAGEKNKKIYLRNNNKKKIKEKR